MSRASRHLRKINNEMQDRIDPADSGTMTDIVCYLRSTNLTAMQQEEVRRDIMDMLIDGRRRGQTASDVIGEDYRAFCDEIVASIAPVSPWYRVLNWTAGVLAALAIMCWIALFAGVIDAAMQDMLPNVSIRVGQSIAFVMYAAAAVVMVWSIGRHALDSASSRNKLDQHKVAICVAYILVLAVGTTISIVVTASFAVPVIGLAAVAVIFTAFAALLDYFL